MAKQAKELFTVVDIETTGLDHNTDQIIELAAIQTNLEKEVGRLHLRIKLHEGQVIPEKITKMTDIREEDLTDGYPENLAVVLFGMFSAGSTIVAHSASFDFSFLEKFGVQSPIFLCTKTMAKLENPDESSSLEDVCGRLGIELNGHHQAMNDVKATVEVLAELIRRLNKKEIPRIKYHNLVVHSEERPLSFVPKYTQINKRTWGS
ncbi:Exonuclease [Thermoactinomyces sp. DSM 45891]|uniref:3'-5' exonuclease n=1 Tax=Thermoactinomyces sp. DSM 45891 TaxID=1761907 RepID=UPI00091CF3D3|nr:3'-5' exonuclease [Thermoactinomyces sp. DSM 45891]SFX48052.1 Exonuclease [Thermoactinomyces sp. DSM 45891]